MKIVLKKTSFVDYPGCVSTALFFSGCKLRCPWCQNRELVLNDAEGYSHEDCLAHVRKRRALLGGVVLSGGEPCLWDGLPDFIGEIKKLSLRVKLDTNGMFPDMLEKLFSREETRPDYIALDLKIAPERYRELLPPGIAVESCEARSLSEVLIQSAALIRESGIIHEYRSLALPAGFITEKDIEALAPLADNSPWHFRLFRGGNCLESAWDSLEESAAKAHSLAETLAKKARELGKNGIAH
jgi:pyruvate formate lyase activating enzyme